MKTKQIIVVIIILVAAGAIYWLGSNNTQNNPIGGQKDAYGCLTAAGYSWCAAKTKCIRQWEEYCTATTPKNRRLHLR